jgi:hypothetical protein
MSRFQIELLGGHLWLTVLVCLALVVTAFLYYRRTTPPLSRSLRWVLLALRALAIVSVFLALAQPIVSYTETTRQQKRMAVLVDRSRSMNLPLTPGAEGTRLEAAEQVLAGAALAPLRDNLDLTSYAFAESLDVDPSGPHLTGVKTDFGQTIKQIRQTTALNPYDYLLLISDGRATEGENLADAAASLGYPLYAVAVGDSVRHDNLALDGIDYDDVLYAGRQAEIKSTVSQQGELAGNLTLTLSDERSVLARKAEDLPGDGKNGQYALTFTPTTPGRFILNLDVASSTGESNKQDNRRKFAVRVLKSKLNILLYSSSLNQEYAFLNRYLGSRSDYEVTSVIDGGGGDRLGERFPTTQEAVNSFDLLILIDPDLARLSSHYDRLVSFLADRGGGMMILMGAEYARSAPQSRVALLSPLAVSSSRRQALRYGTFRLTPDPRMIFHPAIKLADTREEILTVWANRPPFTLYLPVDSVPSNATVLGYIGGEQGESRDIAMAFRRQGAGKVLACAAAPFWYWAFYPVGVGGDASIYQEFFSASIRWLTISDESDRAGLRPIKDVFQNGEAVVFEGFVRDEGFRPLEGVSGDLTIVSSAGDTTVSGVVPDGRKPGGYRSEPGALAPGTYQYRADLAADSVRLGRFEGTFAVDDVDRETAWGDVDWTSLAQAAGSSGGAFVSYRDVRPLLDAVDISVTDFEETHDIRLWDHLVLLIIIISALSLEWVIRKQRQLL